MFNTALKYKLYNGYSIHSSNQNSDIHCKQSRLTLNDECYELWRCNQISESIQKIKYQFLDNLQELFREIFPYVGLYIIGSTVNGFGQCQSELDICLMISHETFNELESGYILQKIRDSLQKGEYFRNVKLVKRTYSILILSDLITSMTCNIYLNESMMIRNTYLMRFYSECDHRLPILINAIKYWTLKINLKQRTQNSLNGYCLTLMCIYYLQVTFSLSPIIPRFSEILSNEKFNKDIDIRKLNLMDTIEFAKVWVSKNVNIEVGDLFLGFLKFYAIEFDFVNDMISIRTGKKTSKRQSINANDRIVIEEPLTGMNIASGISTEKIYQEILQIFRLNYNKISSSSRLICL